MTVRVEFKYALEFVHLNLVGQETHGAIEHHFTDRNAALEAHWRDCKGGWVEFGMRRPAVGPLLVVKNGSLLPDPLRAGVDLDEIQAVHHPTCSADRRDDTDRHLRAVPTPTDV